MPLPTPEECRENAADELNTSTARIQTGFVLAQFESYRLDSAGREHREE